MEEVFTWDKQPNEPQRWYHIFVKYYMTMGAARSLRGAYLHFVKDTEPERYTEELQYKSAPGAWIRMSHEWNWAARAEAFEAYQTEQAMATVEFASQRLRQAALDAVNALILSLTSERYRVSAAKEILDRAGLPATVRQEVDNTLHMTSDDIARARNEVQEWEQRQKELANGSSVASPAGTSLTTMDTSTTQHPETG